MVADSFRPKREMNKGEEDWVNAVQGMNAAETGLQPKGRQHSR